MEKRVSALAPALLLPFDATGREDWATPLVFEDNVELVETVGRYVHPETRGGIPEMTPKLLGRVGIDTEAFIAHGTRFIKAFGHAVGWRARQIKLAAYRQAKFLRRMMTAKAVFSRKAA